MACDTTHPSIPLLDLKRPMHVTPGLRDDLVAAMERVLDSGMYILGTEVEAFEAAAAAYCRVGHAIGVSSGTDALLLSLMALGIGAGDDVLCPTYTFFATAGTVARVGARPVFVDCCPGCFNMLPQAASERMTPNTQAMMPVHLFGQLAAMPQLQALAQRFGLAVIEDAAQALGAQSSAGRAGALGHVGCFSFFPSKNLGALGDAGMVTTQDSQLAARLRVLRVHGSQPKYFHSMVGGNFRLDALQAAVLRTKLPHLDAASAARAQHAAQYHELFTAAGMAVHHGCICQGETVASPRAAAPLSLPTQNPGRHIYNQYIVRIGGGRRDAVRTALAAGGIGAEVYYPVPMHLQPCFAHLGYRPGDFPNAEAAAQDTLALPIFPELRSDEVARIAACVLQACRT